MAPTIPNIDELTVRVNKEINVEASLDNTFDALIEQIGAHNEGPDDTPMPMTIEAWPGGRWFRDLGDGNGHNWGHVQAIKRPTLLEISGPMFMSYAAAANIQYRLAASADGTVLSMQFSALGLIPDEHRVGMEGGWMHLINRVKAAAEQK
jgi:uncharacterized protein YndB with AHSA1/START domain